MDDAASDTAIRTDLEMRAEIKLYYDLYVPPGLNPNAPLLIAVHGYGAHKRYMMREARLVANDRFVIASIQAPHQHYRQIDGGGYRVGFGWLSDYKPEEYVEVHHRFVLDVIDRLAADGLVDRKSVCLYGFSQACALNFRFAFTHGDAIAGVIGVCGGVPGDLETNERYKPFAAETFYLYGDDDEFYSQEKFGEFDGKLLARLPNYRSKHYKAKHEITNEMREDVAKFLAELI
jgi:predicted esterase